MLSIGGSTQKLDVLSNMVKTTQSRSNFIENTVKFLKDYSKYNIFFYENEITN